MLVSEERRKPETRRKTSLWEEQPTYDAGSANRTWDTLVGEGVGGRPEYLEKNLSEQGENQQQTQPTYGAGSGNRTRAALVGEGGRGWEEDRSTRRKTARSKERTNNKLNPHMAPGPGIEPRPHWWEASALTTAPPSSPSLML